MRLSSCHTHASASPWTWTWTVLFANVLDELNVFKWHINDVWDSYLELVTEP